MIVIAGKNNIAVFALNYMLNELKIKKEHLAVVCNRTETGKDSWQMSLQKRAFELGVTQLSLEDAQLNAEIFISLEFDRIIKPELFKTDRLFNIHFSLLPKFKGMYTSIWPILLGEDRSGTTLHHIDSGIDTGWIIEQDAFEIAPEDTSKCLYLKYIDSAIKLFTANVSSLLNENFTSKPQSSSRSTYFSKASIDFANLSLDMDKTAWEIGRQIRAYAFRDYQLPVLNNTKISNFEILSSTSQEKPGTILSFSEDFLEVATIDYDVILYKDRSDELFSLMNNSTSSVELMERYLKNLPNINDRNHKSWSLLMVAAYNNNYDLATKLIQSGADIHAKNYKHTSVLMYAKDGAIRHNDNRLFQDLLNLGADVEHEDLLGCSLRDYVSSEDMAFLLKKVI